MTTTTALPREIALEVRDRCLCFVAQRTARQLARRFDRLLKPLGLTNGQFSMMVAMGGMGEPTFGALARSLAMDHATVTAAIGKLDKRGLVAVRTDGDDRRARRVKLTASGVALIEKAVPLWRDEHSRLDAELGSDGVPSREIRAQLLRVAPLAAASPAPASAAR